MLNDDSSERFNISQTSIDSIKPQFLDLFPQSPAESPWSKTNAIILISNITDMFPTTNAVQALWATPNATQLFENMALSMTNQLRQSDPGHSLVQGTAHFNVTIIRVNWSWIVLPVGLPFLGCIFLILSVRKTRQLKQPIWKDECLPVLFCSLQKPGAQMEMGSRKLYDMKQTAQRTQVQIVEGPVRLVLGK